MKIPVPALPYRTVSNRIMTASDTCVLTPVLILFALAAGGGNPALAGTINISGADPGSVVGIGVKYNNGGKLVTGETADANGNVSFFIPDQDNIKIDVICADVQGETRYVENSFAAAVTTLEPFSIPSFLGIGAGSTLVAVVDIVAFLAAGNPFTLNQTIDISNGMTPLTSAIVFRSGSGLPAGSEIDSLLEESIVASLPLFNGSAVVGPADVHAAAVPEPSYAWVALVIAAVLAKRKQPGRL
jgi:hypothetical protein